MLQFTGERYVPSEGGEIRLEHFHRYALARTLSHGKTVLDLACGEGYGSALLSAEALGVLGVDVDKAVILNAQTTYQNLPNLQFQCANVTQTGLPAASFDLVVSFETIEHLMEQTEMLAEIRRVLRPDGVLLISSPNRPVYTDKRQYCNEFHVQELDFAAFDEQIRLHFDQVEYYGQRLAMGTVIQPLAENLATYSAYCDDNTEVQQRTFSMRDPMYFVAVCAAAGQPLPKLKASILMPDSLDLVEHYTSFARWAKQQDHELAIRDKNVRHYQAEAMSLEGKVKALRQELSNSQNELAALHSQRNQCGLEILRAQAQLDLLKSLYADGDLGRI
jgi:ubiquinone/menaquinone biosynthesis C-methylase UbiE